jgi:hypothetical protein
MERDAVEIRTRQFEPGRSSNRGQRRARIGAIMLLGGAGWTADRYLRTTARRAMFYHCDAGRSVTGLADAAGKAVLAPPADSPVKRVAALG